MRDKMTKNKFFFLTFGMLLVIISSFIRQYNDYATIFVYIGAVIQSYGMFKKDD